MAEQWCTLDDRQGAAEAIGRLGREDLVFLHNLIAERLRLIEQARNAALLSRFHTGDRVRFQTSTGEVKTGTVLKLNIKSVAIRTDDGHNWRVWPGHLLPAAPPAAGQSTGAGAGSSGPPPASSPAALPTVVRL